MNFREKTRKSEKYQKKIRKSTRKSEKKFRKQNLEKTRKIIRKNPPEAAGISFIPPTLPTGSTGAGI